MKIRMSPANRDTGNTWSLCDSALSAKAISVDMSGNVKLHIPLGPIQTTGNFNGEITLTLEELYAILHAIEAKKFSLLSTKQDKPRPIKRRRVG